MTSLWQDAEGELNVQLLWCRGYVEVGRQLCMSRLVCIACCFRMLHHILRGVHQYAALSVWHIWVQTVVVDARAHMLGRLASIVAKQLLNGQHVVSCD